jgi:hypothetical protein
MSFSTRGVYDAAPTPPPYSYHASHGYPEYQPKQYPPHPQPQPYHQPDFQNFDTRLTHLEIGQQGIITHATLAYTVQESMSNTLGEMREQGTQTYEGFLYFFEQMGVDYPPPAPPQ